MYGATQQALSADAAFRAAQHEQSFLGSSLPCILCGRLAMKSAGCLWQEANPAGKQAA